MSNIVPTLRESAARAMQERQAAFRLFNEWECLHPSPARSPAEVIADIGALYELLPAASRQRSVDVSGVLKFHNMFTKPCLSE